MSSGTWDKTLIIAYRCNGRIWEVHTKPEWLP